MAVGAVCGAALSGGQRLWWESRTLLSLNLDHLPMGSQEQTAALIKLSNTRCLVRLGIQCLLRLQSVFLAEGPGDWALNSVGGMLGGFHFI